jgi:hypothetical protein
MTITTKDFQIDVQVLEDAVRGRFAQKNVLMNSLLVQGGAVIVNGSMPKGGPRAIGKTIEVPYFGTIGDFADNPDGSSVTPTTLGETSETGTISRDSIAIEVSAWAEGVGELVGADPYQEGVRQIEESVGRAMDKAIVTAAAGTPLIVNHYSATTPVYIDWDKVIDASAIWGDEGDEIVGMAVHSRTLVDMAKLKDASGRPLLLQNMTDGQRQVRTFAGVPLVVSDRCPLTGSAMGTVVSAGTSPPAVTLSGVPLGPWNLKLDCVVGGANLAGSTFRFSTDGGNTWSATMQCAASVPLIDTATDSLVGVNGKTGVTAAFAEAAFNADNEWTATAKLKATSLIFQRGALAFWFNRARMGLQTDKNILSDTDIAAMHLYRVAHRYRRRQGGTKPGVIAVNHNLRNYIG